MGAAADEAENFTKNESCGNQGCQTGNNGIVRPDGFQDSAGVFFRQSEDEDVKLTVVHTEIKPVSECGGKGCQGEDGCDGRQEAEGKGGGFLRSQSEQPDQEGESGGNGSDFNVEQQPW